MAHNFPRKGLFVGRELPNGNLELYSTDHELIRLKFGFPGGERGYALGSTPVRYTSGNQALRQAKELNESSKEKDNPWKVYHMTIEEVNPIHAVLNTY